MLAGCQILAPDEGFGTHLIFCNFQMKSKDMSKEVKTKIHLLLDGIEDEAILNQVMEEVAFYANKKDITDDLNTDQLNELDKAMEEANKKETIPWDDFKKEMD
jgi:hypothetical protein